jgi:hypothetical protein
MTNNPISVTIEVENGSPPQIRMKLSLTPDGVGLRSRFKALIVHYHIVDRPIVWNLGKDIQLLLTVPCGLPPKRLVTTVYGVRQSGGLELIFNNWETPEEKSLLL